MDSSEDVLRGILGLPNEILLHIFSVFPTKELVQFTTTCRHFYSLVLRLIHHRLQIAAGLDGYTLYLECHHPSASLTSSKLFCSLLRTDGLQELLADTHNEASYIGQMKQVGSLYSRFQPQQREPDFSITRRHPAGDIPGSRTHPSNRPAPPQRDPDDVVSRTVTVEAHDLFSQLSTSAFLGKHEYRKGMLLSIQEISEGTVRVWRDWLSKQCESKSWTDGEPVPVHHDVPSSPSGEARARAGSVAEYPDPTKDPNILWLNTRDDNVGIKFRVKARKWRQNNPILYSSDVEVAVSYQVEFEEILVRTTHLLLKIEEARRASENPTSKAIVFGSFGE